MTSNKKITPLEKQLQHLEALRAQGYKPFKHESIHQFEFDFYYLICEKTDTKRIFHRVAYTDPNSQTFLTYELGENSFEAPLA